MQGELKLTSYSFESCAAAVLQRRLPHVPQPQLAHWFNAGPAGKPPEHPKLCNPNPRLNFLFAAPPLMCFIFTLSVNV